MAKQATCSLTVSSPNNSHWNVVIMSTTTNRANPQTVPLKPIKPDPVKIVEDKIRIDEDQMEDGVPYAFQYQDEYYMLTRIDGKLTLYGLR